MRALWTPTDPATRLGLHRTLVVIDQAGQLGCSIPTVPTIRDLVEIVLATFPRNVRGERTNMEPVHQDLAEALYSPLTDMRLTQTVNLTVRDNVRLFVNWGGVGAIYDKLAYIVDQLERGVQFSSFGSLGGDREFDRNGLDRDELLFHPEKRWSNRLRLLNTDGVDKLRTEADLVKWLLEPGRLNLPTELTALPFWQADSLALAEFRTKHGDPTQLRASAAEALQLWPGLTDIRNGHVAMVGKQPHNGFQANDFADAFAPDTVVEWGGPGVSARFVPNSVAQFLHAARRAVESWLALHKRQGTNPYAV